MKKRMLIGNSKIEENAQIDANSFPKIANLLSTLEERERQVLSALIEKDPSQTWESVADGIGLSVRQLFNIRHRNSVQEAYYEVSRELLKRDAPEVLKILARRARLGEFNFIKLYLEIVGIIKRGNLAEENLADSMMFSNLSLDSDELRERARLALGLTDIKKLSAAELETEFIKRMKLENKGVNAFFDLKEDKIEPEPEK